MNAPLQTFRLLVAVDLSPRRAWHEQLRAAITAHRPHAVCVMGEHLDESISPADSLTLVETAQQLAALPVEHLVFVGASLWFALESVWPYDRRSLDVLTQSGHRAGPLTLSAVQECHVTQTRRPTENLWLTLPHSRRNSSAEANNSVLTCDVAPLLVVCGSDHPEAPRRGIGLHCKDDRWHLQFARRSDDAQHVVVLFHFLATKLAGMQVLVFPPS